MVKKNRQTKRYRRARTTRKSFRRMKVGGRNIYIYHDLENNRIAKGLRNMRRGYTEQHILEILKICGRSDMDYSYHEAPEPH